MITTVTKETQLANMLTACTEALHLSTGAALSDLTVAQLLQQKPSRCSSSLRNLVRRIAEMKTKLMQLADMYAGAMSSRDIISSRAALEAEIDRVCKNAERWQTIKSLFRVMSLHMNGDHVWVQARTCSLVGASMDEAIDKLIDTAMQGETT